MADEIDRAWQQQARIPDRDWELRQVAFRLITQVEIAVSGQQTEAKELETWVREYRSLRKRQGRGWLAAQEKAYPDIFNVLAKAVSLERDLYLEGFTALPNERIRKAIQDGKLPSLVDGELGKLYLYKIDGLEAVEVRWALTTIWARIHASKHGAKLLKSLKDARRLSSDPVVIAEYRQGKEARGLNFNYFNLTIAGIGDRSMTFFKWTREDPVHVLSNELFESVWGLEWSTDTLEFQTLTMSLSGRLAKEAMGKEFSFDASDLASDIKQYKSSPSYTIYEYEEVRHLFDAVTQYVTAGRRTSFLQMWPIGHLGHDPVRGKITVGARSYDVEFGFSDSTFTYSGDKTKLTVSTVQGLYGWSNGKEDFAGKLDGTLVIDFEDPPAQTLQVPQTVVGELAGRQWVRSPRMRLDFDWKLTKHGKESGKGYFLIDFEQKDAYVGEWGHGQERSGGGFWTGQLAS
ncbi:MAG: hypothetical protein AAGC60_25055 [Acidobacteriota bacterium]